MQSDAVAGISDYEDNIYLHHHFCIQIPYLETYDPTIEVILFPIIGLSDGTCEVYSYRLAAQSVVKKSVIFRASLDICKKRQERSDGSE